MEPSNTAVCRRARSKKASEDPNSGSYSIPEEDSEESEATPEQGWANLNATLNVGPRIYLKGSNESGLKKCKNDYTARTTHVADLSAPSAPARKKIMTPVETPLIETPGVSELHGIESRLRKELRVGFSEHKSFLITGMKVLNEKVVALGNRLTQVKWSMLTEVQRHVLKVRPRAYIKKSKMTVTSMCPRSRDEVRPLWEQQDVDPEID
ncbi:hypothetical protein Bca52824_032958 [Brassica carinata]|uniref:Uncharacterized protein n=1 Tax=Brassica carinata TaxID=52824 RepID=A0A8X7V6T8_BRACI|nr:hypothetical protein Bca52824_032958 [Brassica carinata]